MIKKTLFASAVLIASATVHAEGGYFGVSIGQTEVDITGFDDGDSVSITGGYRVNKNFAIEATYIDFGESEDDEPPIWTIEADGFNFSAVGIIPVSEKVEVFGKVGMLMWDATLEEAGFGELASDDGNDISLGFGVSAMLADQIGVVFEYQKFDFDDDDVTNLSIGARLKF